MNVSLSDEELSIIVIGLTAPMPQRNREKEGRVIFKLVGAKREYDALMAESAPLGLIARLKSVYRKPIPRVEVSP